MNTPLLTDLYQLTMAYGYWKSGRAEQEACFNLFFRNLPFNGGYAIAAGLSEAMDFIRDFQFSRDDLDYLKSLEGNDGKQLFENDFLTYLSNLQLSSSYWAVQEGTVIFGHEPLMRVIGPILQCQLLESALLHIFNFNTLIATKAARIVHAAAGDPVFEFGLRRAQSPLQASRAAYIGGCTGTSNVLAGKKYGIPVKGTHAHSWVMSFPTEIESFDAYAKVMPNNCLLLVDTYNTLDGVRNAIRIGIKLRETGHKFIGIRLDSGDLGYLSIEAHKMLEEAGFGDAIIAATNDLDEYLIESLKHQGAKINLWGVGTKLVTAYDQPALGGVYKLGAILENGVWTPKVKLSERSSKTSIPGVLQVRRFEANGQFLGDQIYGVYLNGRDVVKEEMADQDWKIIDQNDMTRQTTFKATRAYNLLLPFSTKSDMVSAGISRLIAQNQLEFLHPAIKRLQNPHEYPVGLHPRTYFLRNHLIQTARKS